MSALRGVPRLGQAPVSAPRGAPPRGAPPPGSPAAAGPLLAPRLARLVGLLLLGGWAAGQWSRLVEPAAPGATLGALVLAVALAELVDRVGPGRRRVVAAGLAGVAFAAGVLLLAGAPPRLLTPSGWGGLASGIGEGIQALPGATTPYDGADPWARTVILAGGGLLLGGGVLASRVMPAGGLGARAAAAVPLVVTAAVPGVVLVDQAGVAGGLALFAALAAFLWLDRLGRAEALGALGLATVAGVAGVIGGAAIDAKRPWVDYESIAQHLSAQPTDRFDWTQRYGPLDWPRTGRELLRVAMPRRAYLKTQNLDAFDGVRWRPAVSSAGIDRRAELPATPALRQKWTESVRIVDRGLSSDQLVAAGTTLSTGPTPSPASPAGSPGTYVLSRPLKPGDAYVATVYYPRPSPGRLAGAGEDYPQALDPYLILSLPVRRPGAGAVADVQFPFYGQRDAPSVLLPDGSVQRSAAFVARSPYGAAYRLAHRLAARSSSPYDYVRRVRNYLAVTNGFRYVEDVPRARLPLERFLFADRRGYCQYFSGAMALLLRMAGIPARVAAGFTPGGRDALRHEWVVRDFDAHAWVEAWFPGIGWTTFDPTPTAAPALLGTGAGRTIARVGERVTKHQRQPRKLAAVPASHHGGGLPAWVVVLGALLLAAGAAGTAVLVRRREPVEGDVAELNRALRRCGRSPAPELTLSELERRLRGAPDAAAYVRALREAHYGYGIRATTAQRRALRHELGRGLGLLGRLRAFWALPPRRA